MEEKDQKKADISLIIAGIIVLICIVATMSYFFASKPAGGETVTISVIVHNPTNEELPVVIYLSDRNEEIGRSLILDYETFTFICHVPKGEHRIKVVITNHYDHTVGEKTVYCSDGTVVNFELK